MLELWGSCSILTETTGLSGAVDLAQSVQCLALGMLQQICLALSQKQRPLSTTHNDDEF